jgi:hypothetical protein
MNEVLIDNYRKEKREEEKSYKMARFLPDHKGRGLLSQES